jgi:hypothetical protein
LLAKATRFPQAGLSSGLSERPAPMTTRAQSFGR